MDRTTTRHNGKRMVMLGAVLLAGAAVGVTGISLASASSASNRGQQAAAVYPKDAKGLTYGSGLQANSPANEPELIQVTATNGKTGYVYRTDITAPEPASPQEAAARSATNQGSKTVPVYG